jgi:cytochrome c oxidase subunit 4
VANPTKHDEGHGGGEHAHGIGRYFLVWFALILGTTLTVITGRMDLGAGNIFLALAIASVKATLVILFFMHMVDTPAANRIVFVTSIVFAIVLIVGVFGDLLTRNAMTLPSAAPSTEGPEIQVPASATPGHEP